jgi:hypothetical protein
MTRCTQAATAAADLAVHVVDTCATGDAVTSSTGILPEVTSKVVPMAADVCSTTGTMAATLSGLKLSRLDVVSTLQRADSRIVGQACRPHNYVAEPSALELDISTILGMKLNIDSVIPVGSEIGAARADHHVPLGAIGFGPIDQLDDASVMHH